MCRITCIKGNLNQNAVIRKIIDDAQQYGGNVGQELFADQDLTIMLNRFAVTSSGLTHGSIPIVTDHYVLAFNGEIYAFRGERFDPDIHESDGHFAMPHIREQGHEVFFREADMEGTFFIYDRKKKVLYVYADQLNTKGCFYANTPGNIIVSQELSIVKTLLDHCHAKKDTAISILPRGNCLRIDSLNELQPRAYKINFKRIWTGHQLQDFAAVTKALITAVVNRIPARGKFGMLCSGGVDSSLILLLTVKYLRERGELDRLVVFILGFKQNPLKGEENDLLNLYRLLELTGLKALVHVHSVYPEPAWDKYLIETAILTASPHLISPNPAVTQVRHINTMSGVLAQIAMAFPTIKIVLTGDFADEIFAGYNSMHTGNLDELATNIQHKLDDLQLNDAARVTLASLRGCQYLLKGLMAGKIRARSEVPEAAIHPIEVRTPYASHLLADALIKFSKNALICCHEGKIHSKYLLRLVAQSIGMPPEIAWRKKMPFNEGGTGIRNTEPYEQEENASLQYLQDRYYEIKNVDLSLMPRFNISPYIEKYNMPAFEFALYCTSMKAGLDMLCLGKTFRDRMPDSNYASKGNLEQLYIT